MLRFFQSSGTAFFAGALSLVSQIVGLQIVARELASTDLAIASVLVSALIGLSLGALIAGRLSDLRVQKGRDSNGLPSSFPLSLAQVLIALAAIAVLVFSFGGSGFAAAIRNLGLDETVEVFCFSLGTILPINILLGGIVPVLTRATVSQTNRNVQNAFGRIYALETCGAALGSLAVTFYAIPRFGMRSSLKLTGVIVLVWALLCLIIRWKQLGTATGNSDAGEAPKPMDSSVDDGSEPNCESTGTAAATRLRWSLRWLLLLAATASSCASLGMELVWQRYFAVVFGSDTHSYAIVATLFLVGNSIGALVASFGFGFLRSNRSSNKTIYQWLLMLIGGSIVLSIWSLGFCFRSETMHSVLAWLAESPLLGRLLLASLVMLLPSILIGSALPVLVNLWTEGQESIGARAGEIYASVILGNVLGVLLCASWLIPTFGLRITSLILAGICVSVSLGLMLLAGDRTRSKRTKQTKRTAYVAVAIGCYWILLAGFAVATVKIANSDFRPGLSDDGRWVVDHYVEKASHTLAVAHNAETPTNKRLIIDGVTIGESGGGVDEKQQVLAHLPFLIGEAAPSNSSKVLTIGLGTGILAGELAINDQVESLTCVEISSEVIKASKWFSEENRHVLDSPKLNLVHGDGVRYLRNADQKFDVIVSDGKSRPGAASNLPFFSEEFYRLCSDSLSEQGVFVQWVSLRCDQEELETILYTFSNKFPFGHVAVAAPDSIYLVGTRSPIYFSSETIENYLQHDWTERLRGYSWKTIDDILSMYWLDDEVIHNAFSGVTANTFDRPVLDRFAWKSFQHSLTQQPTQLAVLQELVASDDTLFNDKPLDQFEIADTVERIRAGRKSAIELMKAESIRVAAEDDWLDRSTVHFKNALQHLPQLNRQSHVVEDFRVLAEQARLEQDAGLEFSTLINISELNGASAAEEFRMAQILQQQQADELALDHYFKAVKLSNEHPRYLIAFGEALFRQRRFARHRSSLNVQFLLFQNPQHCSIQTSNHGQDCSTELRFRN